MSINQFVKHGKKNVDSYFTRLSYSPVFWHYIPSAVRLYSYAEAVVCHRSAVWVGLINIKIF